MSKSFHTRPQETVSIPFFKIGGKREDDSLFFWTVSQESCWENAEWPWPDTETEAWSLEEAAHNAVYPVPTLITGQEQLCWFEKLSVI